MTSLSADAQNNIATYNAKIEALRHNIIKYEESGLGDWYRDLKKEIAKKRILLKFKMGYDRKQQLLTKEHDDIVTAIKKIENDIRREFEKIGVHISMELRSIHAIIFGYNVPQWQNKVILQSDEPRIQDEFVHKYAKLPRFNLTTLEEDVFTIGDIYSVVQSLSQKYAPDRRLMTMSNEYETLIATRNTHMSKWEDIKTQLQEHSLHAPPTSSSSSTVRNDAEQLLLKADPDLYKQYDTIKSMWHTNGLHCVSCCQLVGLIEDLIFGVKICGC